MSNTITIIELLNKIANGEEVPEKIKYDGFVWELGADINKGITYINNKENDLFNEYLDMAIIESLNNTVEILEDEDTIDIDSIEELDKIVDYAYININNIADNNRDKINELIKAVNKHSKEIKEIKER